VSKKKTKGLMLKGSWHFHNLKWS